MPVAKKTTNNNKKQKSSLIQKLKLNTLTGRMLATVIVFAIIGGGVMVYRSFAYTLSGTSYFYPASSFKRGSQQNCTTSSSVDATNKGQTTVATLSCNGSPGYAVASVDINDEIAAGRDYIICATIKSIGTARNITFQGGGSLVFSQQGTAGGLNINNSSYTEYCSSSLWRKNSGLGQAIVMLNATGTVYGINVSQITLRQVGTPAGTPSPAK